MRAPRPLCVLALAPLWHSADAVTDFLMSFHRHSRHRFYYVFDVAELDRLRDLDVFDVIVVMFTLDLRRDDLTAGMRERLRNARALKVAFLQDECYRVATLTARLAEIGAGVVFSCTREQDHDALFPARQLPALRAVHTVLPGYVPSRLARQPAYAGARPIDVGYRARTLPFAFGDLAREKHRIGEIIGAACAARGLRTDISTLEHDRVYGSAWTRFLRRTRCVLGTPSGASVIDMDGAVHERTELFRLLHPDASYEEVRRHGFARVDGPMSLETASPRVFEAAACGTTMVHLEGRYGGVMEPGRHYIEVKRDYANLDDVLLQIGDRSFCRQIAANARRDLIDSGRFSYARFVQHVDDVLDRHTPGTVAAAAPSRLRFHARTYRWRGPSCVPFRHAVAALPTASTPLGWLGWLARTLPAVRRRPAAYRFALNPNQAARMVRTTWRLIATRPAVRAIVVGVFADAGLRRAVSLPALAEDLIKLEMLRCAGRGLVREPVFCIEIHRPCSDTVIIESRPGGHGLSRPELPATAVPEIRRLIWNHSAVGMTASCEPWPGRHVRVGFVHSGIYLFAAVPTVSRLAPHLVAPLLADTLDAASP